MLSQVLLKSLPQSVLFDALIAAIHSHPLQWHLVVTIGKPEDPTNDATIPWPPDRQQVDAETLTIDQVESEWFWPCCSSA